MRAERTQTAAQAENKIGWGNIALILLLIVLPTTFGFMGKSAEMGIIIVACSLALCFANLHKIESFKGAGFEARMREVTEVVQEAYATVGKLQELALPVVRANIANITYGGRWDGIGREREHELVRQFTELAESLEVQNDPEVKKMTKDFYDHQVADHIRFLVAVMANAHIQNAAVQQKLETFLIRTDDWIAPSVAEIHTAVVELEEDEKALLEPFIVDYEHYVRTKKHRRIEATSHYDLPSFDQPAAQ